MSSVLLIAKCCPGAFPCVLMHALLSVCAEKTIIDMSNHVVIIEKKN